MLQLRPPSIVLASAPPTPGANAVPLAPPARSAVKLPSIRPPTGANVTPSSSEITVAPFWPAAATRVGEANAAA